MVKIYMKGNKIYKEVNSLFYNENSTIEVITVKELVELYNQEKQFMENENRALHREIRTGEAYAKAIADVIKILELQTRGEE